MALRTALALSTLALATALSNLAVADDVKATNPETLAKTYGRAGVLAGSDRVVGLTAGDQPVGITYDRDVAQRTNMATDRTPEASVGVTYDEQVAERTNMQRGSSTSVVAEQPHGKTSN